MSAEYDLVMEQVQLLAGLAKTLDDGALREAIGAHRRIHSLAPIIAPSSYRGGGERVSAMTRLLESAREFRAAAISFQEVVERTEPAAGLARAEARAILGGGGP